MSHKRVKAGPKCKTCGSTKRPCCWSSFEAKEPKKGPGRPPLSPGGGKTEAHRIRLGPSHVEELEALVRDGKAPNVSGAVRWLIERSAASRTPASDGCCGKRLGLSPSRCSKKGSYVGLGTALQGGWWFCDAHWASFDAVFQEARK